MVDTADTIFPVKVKYQFIIATVIAVVTVMSPSPVMSQSFNNRAWLYFTHTNKIKGPFELLAEAQFRTANEFEYLETNQYRTALLYNSANKKHQFGAGYLFQGDAERVKDRVTYERTREHRIFQQYSYRFKPGLNRWQFRTRFEQRFITEPEGYQTFSQRARFMVNTRMPLNRRDVKGEGMYVVLQNEVMLNVFGKDKRNGRLLDQNRLYGGLGCPVNEILTIELGYIYWLEQEEDSKDYHNVYQLTFRTNL